MKKGKVLGKGQVILALMVLALGAAVWLNMKVSSNTKYLGEAAFVSGEEDASALKTSAKTEVKQETKAEDDYFKTAEEQREKALEKVKKDVAEMLDTEALSDEEKKTLNAVVSGYSDRVEKAVNIENLLKAKGFKKAVAVIGDDSASIVVSSEGLTTAQTLQIQDIVTSQTDIPLGNIKIVAVK